MVTNVFALVKQAVPEFNYSPLTVDEGVMALKTIIEQGGMSND